ncbi:hypothetical protein [Anditalea andensis]|uniref:Uncharacterized protein n=1 Tax=Anditalea andensis TaxID=1048983 RepID=A0A074LNG3_9BACT|nr:hypothetical protein [Anditalea andensis]KEO75462.1 hypothetical protein EL17_01005 [Anditalea andensis]
MKNVDLDKFMVYFENHHLYIDGFSIRQISKETVIRQGQVDFGEYKMRNTFHKRAKEFFFALVLSRYKYV